MKHLKRIVVGSILLGLWYTATTIVYNAPSLIEYGDVVMVIFATPIVLLTAYQAGCFFIN